MTILGVGVDVVHVPRILSLIRRRTPEVLARRILSSQELKEWDGQMFLKDEPSQANYLAVRWSLKEAGYKALFPHEKPTWKEFCVERIHGRKPSLVYTPTSASLLNVRLHCSTSHDGEYVYSSVVAEIDK